MELVKIINLILVVLCVVLAINLIWPIDKATGNLVYALDSSEPRCSFSNTGDLNEVPLAVCCGEIQKMAACSKINRMVFDFRCYHSRNSEYYYLVNSKAMNYCQKEGYDVEIK